MDVDPNPKPLPSGKGLFYSKNVWYFIVWLVSFEGFPFVGRLSLLSLPLRGYGRELWDSFGQDYDTGQRR